MLTYPKSHFSEDDISAPRGCCASKFLYALENDQVLVAHLPTGDGGPPHNFFPVSYTHLTLPTKRIV